MVEVGYYILALWLDEDGVYPEVDHELYFPPAVAVQIDRYKDGKRNCSYLNQNFLIGEDDVRVEYLC